MSRGLLEISVLREAGEGTLWTLAFFAKSRPCHRAFNLQRQTWGLRGGEAHPEPSARRRQVWALDRVPWHATQSSLHSALEKPGRLLSELVSLAADCCAPSPGGAQLVTLSAWASATASLPPAVRHHGEGQERLSFLHGGGQSGEQPRGKCLLHASPVGTSPQPTLLPRKGGWAQGAGTAGEAGGGTWLPGRGPWALGVQRRGAMGSGDGAREAWHRTGAEGRNGERSSRQLGMSHNYRRKIRPEPGSLCLCLSDHRPYYKATNY